MQKFAVYNVKNNVKCLYVLVSFPELTHYQMVHIKIIRNMI